ncbi:MAG: LlaMI family restriction endonuclease [bacterium]
MAQRTPAQAKKRIIQLFIDNVKGRTPDTHSSNIRHDGKGGHWLEKQMGIAHNASNTPDIDGFEMKNDTTSKTTFGDWSPNYRIYKKGNDYGLDRTKFLEIFGAPNPAKDNRYSWSGKPVPKINKYNSFGQKLEIDKNNNILAMYSFSKDERLNKSKIVPKLLQKDGLVIARWDCEKMTVRVERKFNKLGWFKCLIKDGVYTKIVFGDPISFRTWIAGVKKGQIFFDSGMYAGNPRPYAQWRADNKYWDSLITDEY